MPRLLIFFFLSYQFKRPLLPLPDDAHHTSGVGQEINIILLNSYCFSTTSLTLGPNEGLKYLSLYFTSIKFSLVSLRLLSTPRPIPSLRRKTERRYFSPRLLSARRPESLIIFVCPDVIKMFVRSRARPKARAVIKLFVKLTPREKIALFESEEVCIDPSTVLPDCLLSDSS